MSHHSHGPPSTASAARHASRKRSPPLPTSTDASEWLREAHTVPDAAGLNPLLEAGRAMVEHRDAGGLLFQGTGVAEDALALEQHNAYQEAELLSKSHEALLENPLVSDATSLGEPWAEERAAFVRRIEAQQRRVEEKEEFLQRVKASAGKAKEAVLEAEQAASDAFAMFETLRKKGPFMGFDARARTRRQYLEEKAQADALQRKARRANVEAVALKQHVVAHGLDPESFHVMVDSFGGSQDGMERLEYGGEEGIAGAARGDDASGEGAGDGYGSADEGDAQGNSRAEKELSWEEAYLDGVKLAHLQTVDMREQRYAREKKKMLRRQNTALYQQKQLRQQLLEHSLDQDNTNSALPTSDVRSGPLLLEAHNEASDLQANPGVSQQNLGLDRRKDAFVSKGLTKDTAPIICKAWALAECVEERSEDCSGRHFFVSEEEKLEWAAARERQDAKVELDVILAINAREALLDEVKQEVVSCESRQLSTASTSISVGDIGALLHLLNQLRVATVVVVEAIERWQTHMQKHFKGRVQLIRDSKSTDDGWVVKLASKGEQLYSSTTAYKSKMKRLSRDARPAKHATNFEVVGVFPSKLEAIRAFEHLRSLEAAKKMTTVNNLPPFKVVTRPCGKHMCVESDVGLQETRCELCHAAALGNSASVSGSPGGRPFRWNGTDYLQSINKDTCFLEDSSVLKRFFAKTDFSFYKNPLLLAKDLSHKPLEPAPLNKMDMSTSEEQYSAHYAEYIAESFGVPTAQVLIYDNGCAEWFGHVSKTPKIKVGTDLGFVSQLVTDRGAVDAFVKRYRHHSITVLDTARVLRCLTLLTGEIPNHSVHSSPSTVEPPGLSSSLHLPPIREEDILEHGEDFSWLFELALGRRRKIQRELTAMERLRLNRVRTAYYWDSGEYIAIRQKRHEDSGFEAGVFCSNAPGKPWENDRIRGSHKQRFAFEQNLKQQGETLRLRRSMIQIYIKREEAKGYRYRPFVLDYLIYVAKQLGGSTLLLDVQQAETFLQNMISRVASSIAIQRIVRAALARRRFAARRSFLQRAVKQACALDRVAAAQSRNTVASVLQRAICRARSRVKRPQLKTSLNLDGRLVTVSLHSPSPSELERKATCLACLNAIPSRMKPRRDLSWIRIRGFSGLGDAASIELGNLHLQRVSQRADTGPCYCQRVAASSQMTFRIYDSATCQTSNILLSERRFGFKVEVLQKAHRLRLKISRLRRAVSRQMAAVKENRQCVEEAAEEERWRTDALARRLKAFEEERMMAVAAEVHLQTMRQVAEGAVAFSNEQLTLYSDLQAFNKQNAWDPLEEANNAIYLQRKRQAEKVCVLARSRLNNARRALFHQQMSLSIFRVHVQDKRDTLKTLQEKLLARTIQLDDAEAALGSAIVQEKAVVDAVLSGLHILHTASPSKVTFRVGRRKEAHPVGLLHCSVRTVHSPTIPRVPVAQRRIRITICPSTDDHGPRYLASLFTWKEPAASRANPFDPTWTLQRGGLPSRGLLDEPFVSSLIIRCTAVDQPCEDKHWKLAPADLLYLLKHRHRGLPGLPVPELTSTHWISEQLSNAKTYQQRRGMIESMQGRALARVIELVHIGAFDGELKLGKLSFLHLQTLLIDQLECSQWWRDAQRGRTSMKGVLILAGAQIIAGRMEIISVYENHGHLTVELLSQATLNAAENVEKVRSGKTESFCISECDIRDALQDRPDVLHWWSQSVRCCRYSPKLIRFVLDRVFIIDSVYPAVYAIKPSLPALASAYPRLSSKSGAYNFFLVSRVATSISDFDVIVSVTATAQCDMRFVVERRPLGLDPLLSVTLSRLDLRELHAAMDWPDECIARREYKRMSNQIVSLLAIRRRQEDQPLISEHPKLRKYCKMLRLGVPVLGVRQKICLDFANTSAPLAEICRAVLDCNPRSRVPEALFVDVGLTEELVLSNKQQEEHWRFVSAGQITPRAPNASACGYELLHRFSNLWIKVFHDESAVDKASTGAEVDAPEEQGLDGFGPREEIQPWLISDEVKDAVYKSLRGTASGMVVLSGSNVDAQRLAMTKADLRQLDVHMKTLHEVTGRTTASVGWVSPLCGPEYRVQIYDPVFCNTQLYRVCLKAEKDVIDDIETHLLSLPRWLGSLSICYCKTGGNAKGYQTWRRYARRWNGHLCLLRVLVHKQRKDIRVVIFPVHGALNCSTIFCSSDCPVCQSSFATEESSSVNPKPANAEASVTKPDPSLQVQKLSSSFLPERRVKRSQWREMRMQWMRQNREFKPLVLNPLVMEELHPGSGVVGNGPERGGCVHALKDVKSLSILLTSFQWDLLHDEHCLHSMSSLHAFLEARCFFSHGSDGEDIAGFNLVLSRRFYIRFAAPNESNILPVTAIAREAGVEFEVNEDHCRCSLYVAAITLRTFFQEHDSLWMSAWHPAMERFLAEMAIFEHGSGHAIQRFDEVWVQEMRRRERAATAKEMEKKFMQEEVLRQTADALEGCHMQRLLTHCDLMREARETIECKELEKRREEWERMSSAEEESKAIRGFLAASSSSMARVIEAFELFDADKSGTVNSAEFQELCFEIGEVYSKKQVATIIEEMDADGNGEIDLVEFTVWWFSCSHDATSRGVQFARLKAKLMMARQMRKMKDNAKAMRKTMGRMPTTKS